VGDKPLPETVQVVVQKLISWASEQHPKSNSTAKLKNNQQTITTHWHRGQQINHWPCPRESGRGKEAPSKPTQWKPNSKAGWLVGYRADLWNLSEATPHWGRSWLSSCCWKTEEILARLPNHLVRQRQNLSLNTNTKTGCWRSNFRTTKTAILLFLNLEFFCVFFCFVSCLFVCVCLSNSPCWFLWVLFCLVFLGFLFLFC
jgi:hypothetical protein